MTSSSLHREVWSIEQKGIDGQVTTVGYVSSCCVFSTDTTDTLCTRNEARTVTNFLYLEALGLEAEFFDRDAESLD